MSNSTLTIEGLFEGNVANATGYQAVGGGAAIYFEEGRHVETLRTTITADFLNNRATAPSFAGGGGLSIYPGGYVRDVRLELTGRFEDNAATSLGSTGFVRGGGFYMMLGDNVAPSTYHAILRATFLRNRAIGRQEANGGGVCLRHSGEVRESTLRIEGNIENNTALSIEAGAAGGGVGLYFYSSGHSIDHFHADVAASFVGNAARGVAHAILGGGMSVDTLHAPTISGFRLAVLGSSFLGCTAASDGGFSGGGGLAVALPSADVQAEVLVRQTGFSHNRAVDVGAGAAGGGGMLVTMPSTLKPGQ